MSQRSALRLGGLTLAVFAASTEASCGGRLYEEVKASPALPLRVVSTAPIVSSGGGPRLMPAEVYTRSYLALFGVTLPGAAEKRARGGDGSQLFDTWESYFAGLGFPDYRYDLPRAQDSNAFMIATFERLGIALCDRAVEHEIKGLPVIGAEKPAPVAERAIFAFDAGDPTDVGAFGSKFDVMHRTFLGYPADLAPVDRVPRFFALYNDVKKHRASAKKTRFSPSEAGWAAVCYGLVRHPELLVY